jgi:hypothetical protein
MQVENVPDFREESDVSTVLREMTDPSPYKIFCQIFSDEMVEHIYFNTNLYVTQRGKPFSATNENEIRVFLGMNLFMGVKKMPSYRDYWSSAPDLHDSYISDLMTVKRFSFLLSHIHLNDNAVMPKRGEKFKGRSSMKQYMRDKPVKRGYKLWMLCDES